MRSSLNFTYGTVSQYGVVCERYAAPMPPPRRSRAERREETRAALRLAAAELFAERGVRGASLDAICARAGFTRGAFHANYASREELFAEVLQERVFAAYRHMAERAGAEGLPTPRVTGERLARVQGSDDGRWLLTLWLELLAHASREPAFRDTAAEFWRGTRDASAAAIERGVRGRLERVPPRHLATAAIALDIGLALQQRVDPEAVPLGLYPELYEALFAP